MVRLFGHFIPTSLLLLAIIEGLLLIGAPYVSLYLNADGVFDSGWSTQLWSALPQALTFGIVLLAMNVGMGLYERNFWNGRVDMLLRIIVGFVLGLISLSLIYFVLSYLAIERPRFIVALGLALLAMLVVRSLFLAFVGQEALKRRILVLGIGKQAEEVKRLARSLENPGFTLVGYAIPPLPNDSAPALSSGGDYAVETASDRAIAAHEKLLAEPTLFDLVTRTRVDEVLLALDDRRQGFPAESILECKTEGIAVSDFLSFYERETGKISVDNLHASNMEFSDGFHQPVLRNTSKRLFDIAASSLLLLLVWPVMLITGLLIYLEDGRPLFYRQERVGRNSRRFNVIKFRSMRTDAEKDGVARWATQNDSRITRVGSVIRKTRIDELPQLINVLRGEMSFVGPRPERPTFVAHLEEKIPFYSMRHRVNPGITGWAQICFPYGASDEDALEKLQYDLYYIKNYSFFLDAIILLQTAYVVLWGKGAR